MNIPSTPFTTLTTKRLQLRKLNIGDAQNLLQLRSNDEVNKYLDRPKTLSLDEAEAYIHKMHTRLENNDCGYWVLSLKDNPELIGTICLWNFKPEKELAEIGYELSPAYWGQGLMQEAVERIIQYAFDDLQLKVITGITVKENQGSLGILKRNKFVEDVDNKYAEGMDDEVVYFLVKE